MGISSGIPTSRRGYLSVSELEQFADVSVTDAAEAADQISQAEEIIDAYVGFVIPYIQNVIEGRCGAASGSNTATLSDDHQNVWDVDYLKGCEIEILGGTGEGQRRRISGQTRAGVITVADDWTTALDTTSFYRIYQLGKFPRAQDVHFETHSEPYQYYKSIPENVKRAVAAQVEFVIQMGTDYFNTDKSDKVSESLGDYSYTKGSGGSGKTGPANLIAPKAKLFLRGYKVRVGVIS